MPALSLGLVLLSPVGLLYTPVSQLRSSAPRTSTLLCLLDDMGPPGRPVDDFLRPATVPQLREFLMGEWELKRVVSGTFTVPSMVGRFDGRACFSPSDDSRGLVSYTESGRFTSKDSPPMETSTALLYDFSQFDQVAIYYLDSSGERRFLHSLDPSTLEMSESIVGDDVQRGQMEIGRENAFILSRYFTGPNNNGSILSMFVRQSG